MAFPGELNINYYKGDTYEFSVYPKNADGSSMNLTNYLPRFTIASARGVADNPAITDDYIEVYASIPEDNPNHIKCAITPAAGNLLDPTKTYYYDVEIRKTQLPYDLIYTLLTGSITLTDQVSKPI